MNNEKNKASSSHKVTNHKAKLIIVLGPTASGKTGLALELCKEHGGEIVSADSRQIYREMNIGTAKEGKVAKIGHKTASVIDGVPQYMIDIADPGENYTLSQYKKEAEDIIRMIIKKGKVPFLVGGTGLYIDAVVENFDISSGKPDYKLREELNKKSLDDLAKELLGLDPDAEFEVDLKNKRRVTRALEVCLTTKKPFTKQKTKDGKKYDVLKLAPKREREELHRKINKRAGEMVKEGLLQEIEGLVEKYGWDNEAMTGIGYREFKEYFEMDPGRISKREKLLEKAIEQVKIDTRRYAKRQMTWFKRYQEINWVADMNEAEKLVEKFLV